MADEPEHLEDELQMLREQRHRARCTRAHAPLLDQLRERSGLSREQAQRWLVTVLCALERPLRHAAADDPRAWLPMKLQEAFQACSPSPGTAASPSDLESFLQLVESRAGGDRAEAEHMTRLVFAALRDCITEGEAQQLSDALPADLRTLWARAC